MQIPIIETKNLILREHRANDFLALKTMWADPKVVEFISGSPSTEQQSWMRLLNYLGHWHLLEFGYWAIEEKSSKRYIGEIGFADFKRDINPPINGIPESGWVLSSDMHGKGYASEALNAILDWSDKNLKTDRTVCIIGPDNLKSIKLAEKCGYVKVVETTFNDKPTIMFSRNKK